MRSKRSEVPFDMSYGPTGKKGERRALVVTFVLLGLSGVFHYYYLYKPALAKSLRLKAERDREKMLLESGEQSQSSTPV